MAYIYAQVTANIYDYRDPADTQTVSWEQIDSERSPAVQYQPHASGRTALSISHLLGSAESLIEAVNQESGISSPVISPNQLEQVLNAKGRTGFDRSQNTLTNFLEQGILDGKPFADGSWLKALQETVKAEREPQAAALLKNAATSFLLQQLVRRNIMLERANVQVEGDYYIAAPRALIAHLSKQATDALKNHAQKQGRIDSRNVMNLREFAEALMDLELQMNNLDARESGKMVRISGKTATLLVPFLQGYADQIQKASFVSLGRESYQNRSEFKALVMSGGRHSVKMTTAEGDPIDASETAVYELTSAEAMNENNWSALLKNKQAKAADNLGAALAGKARSSKPGVIFQLLRGISFGPFQNTTFGLATKQWALENNREAYFMAQAPASRYTSELGNILKDETSGLRDLMRRADITDTVEFQRQMLSALIRVLKNQPDNLQLLTDVIDFMNQVAPTSLSEVGTLNGKLLRLPNLLWARGMRARWGFMSDYFKKFPGAIVESDEMRNLIRRRVMQSAMQSA